MHLTRLLVPASILTDQTWGENVLVTILWMLGTLLIASALSISVFVSQERREMINEKLRFNWGKVKLDLSFVEFIFVSGLACIGASIYVSEPSRIVRAFHEQLVEMNRENATLKEEVTELQRRIEGANKVTVTLILTPPPDVDLRDFDLESIKCHYWLSDHHEVFTDVRNGMAPQDVACRIENVSPDVLILRVNVEQVLQSHGQAIGNKVLAYREQIFPAQPNYHLCAPSKRPCAEEDSWR